MGARFTWFDKFSATLAKIPEDMRGTFALAMIDYGVKEIEPSFEFPYDAIFESVREDIDNSRKARNENKGGRPKGSGKGAGNDGEEVSAPEKKPSEENRKPLFSKTETPVSESGNPNHTNTGHTNTSQEERGAKRKRFSPPTVDEVAAYAREKGLARIDPEAFCDFYASKGWKVGTQTMRDWKAAARNWDRRDSSRKGGAANVDLGRYSKPEGEAF